MTNFIDIVKNILDEQGKSINSLFLDNVISKDTLYKYKQRNPSLKTLVKIANYLKVSIDYMYERVEENTFEKYSNKQTNFYKNLIYYINLEKISNRQFCKNLQISKDSLVRYKNGVEPNIKTLFEIADYFGCNVDDLLTKDNNKS